MSSLKTVVNIIAQVSTDNLFVESFYFAETWKMIQNDQILYPSIWLETPSIVNRQDQVDTYTFGLNVLDRCLEDQSNNLDIWTKTKQIGEYILADLSKRYPKLLSRLSWSQIPYSDAMTDRVFGWRFEFTINSHEIATCNIPSIQLPPGPPYIPCPIPELIPINVDNKIVEWNIDTQDILLQVNQTIPLGLKVEWSLDNFTTIATTGTSFNAQFNSSLLQPLTVYYRITNGVDFSVIQSALIDTLTYQKTGILNDGINNRVQQVTPNNGEFLPTRLRALSLDADWSVETTFRCTRTAFTGQDNIVGYAAGPGIRGLLIYRLSNQIRAELNFFDGVSTSQANLLIFPGINLNEDLHIVFVKKGANRADWKLYVNGVEGTPPNAQLNTINFWNVNTIWGVAGHQVYGSTQGIHYYTRLYTQELTQAQVLALYNNNNYRHPLVETLNEMQFYYNFDDKINTDFLPTLVLKDKSKNKLSALGDNYTVNPIQ